MRGRLTARGPSEIRHNNRSALLGELLRHGAASRTQLAARTGLTPTAITRIARELIELGLLHETGMQQREGQPGRRGVSLDFRAEGAFVIGVGLHASDHSVSLANLRGEVVRRVEIPASAQADPTTTFSFVRETIDDMLAQAAQRKHPVLGMAIAVAGIVDSETRTIVSMPQLGWKSVALDPFFAHTDLPLVVENVNNTLNLAEWRFGISRHHDNVLMLRVSAYVGASAITNGRLLRGSRSSAMVVGHLRAICPPHSESSITSRRCTCGRLGCVNTAYSGQAIVCAVDNRSWESILATEVSQNTARLEEILNAAEDGDRRICQVLHDAGAGIGKTLNELVRIQDPDLIVIGGQVGVSKTFSDSVRASLQASAGNHEEDAMPEVLVSSMTVAQATVYVALDQFAFSARLNTRVIERANRGSEYKTSQVALR